MAPLVVASGGYVLLPASPLRDAAFAALGLACVATAIGFIFGSLFGFVAGYYRNSPVDKAASFLSVIGVSVPHYWLGMVLVIVMRNIDLSVGSVEGFVGMVMGFVQARFLIQHMGFEIGNPMIWIIALAAGLVVGMGIGALQGVIIAYLGVPAFIVTLGGYLVWRGAAWWVTSAAPSPRSMRPSS